MKREAKTLNPVGKQSQVVFAKNGQNKEKEKGEQTMTNWMNDMMNPQKWMTDAMGTAQNTYEYGQRNMQMWRDQAQNAMDTTMKNFQHMNEEWQKAYQTFMGNARKSQEMCFNAMQEGVHNMNNMYTPNTTNTPAPSKQK